jgi:hypothetical protein
MCLSPVACTPLKRLTQVCDWAVGCLVLPLAWLPQVVAHIRACFPDAPIVALGFSQGSNALVHYLGLHATDPPPFAAAISVSNAFNLLRGVAVPVHLAIGRAGGRACRATQGWRPGLPLSECDHCVGFMDGQWSLDHVQVNHYQHHSITPCDECLCLCELD